MRIEDFMKKYETTHKLTAAKAGSVESRNTSEIPPFSLFSQI
jgi:hypothetical protein